jgi:hypothetical protein
MNYLQYRPVLRHSDTQHRHGMYRGLSVSRSCDKHARISLYVMDSTMTCRSEELCRRTYPGLWHRRCCTA